MLTDDLGTGCVCVATAEEGDKGQSGAAPRNRARKVNFRVGLGIPFSICVQQ
jgi:hypothetical protein